MASAEDFLGGSAPAPQAADAFLAPEPAPQAQPLTAGQAATKAVYDRLRYMNDVLSFGAWDKLQAAAKSFGGNTQYADQLARERAATAASTAGLGTAEQIGYGLLASAPLAAVGGLGGAATRVAGLGAPAMPATVTGRIGAGAAEGAAQGALEALGRDQSVTGGATTGAALGGAIPLAAAGLSRVVSPIASQLTAPQQQLAREAIDRGITLTPAQATGSRATGFFESQLRDLPGGAMSPRLEQQQQLQRQLLNQAGIVEDFATPAAIENAFNRTSQDFQNILVGKQVQFGANYGQRIVDTVNQYTNRLDANVKNVFINQARDLLREGQVIDGVRANTIRSDLAALERNYRNQPELKTALGKLRSAVDDAIDNSLSGAEREAMREARGQWKNLWRLDEVMNRAGAQSESGNVPFVQLNNLLKQKAGSAAKGIESATPEFKKLAQIGSQFFREPPSSGTAQRNFFNTLVTGAGAGGLVAGGPTAALGSAAAAIGTPLIFNRLYNTPLARAWFSNQAGRNLAKVDPAAQSALTGAGLGLLGQ